MASVFRVGENDRSGKKFRPQSRHNTNLIDKIREYIKNTTDNVLRKEEIAEIFKAKPHEVEQCFHRLNLEGLISQAKKIEPHDYSRKHGDSCWAADVYHIRKPEQQDIPGKLILTSIDNVKVLNNNIVKLFIARQPANDMEKKGWKWASKLAPSSSLLNSYHSKSIDWDEYCVRYKKEVINNTNCSDALNTVLNHLKAGENIALICYCDDYRFCHRRLLGEYYNDLGVDIINIPPIINRDDYIKFLNLNLFNPEWSNKLLIQSLDSLYLFKYTLERKNTLMFNGVRKKVNFSNTQIRIIIKRIIEEQDADFAKFMKEQYEIPTEFIDKIDSIIVLKGLLD